MSRPLHMLRDSSCGSETDKSACRTITLATRRKLQNLMRAMHPAGSARCCAWRLRPLDHYLPVCRWEAFGGGLHIACARAGAAIASDANACGAAAPARPRWLPLWPALVAEGEVSTEPPCCNAGAGRRRGRAGRLGRSAAVAPSAAGPCLADSPPDAVLSPELAPSAGCGVFCCRGLSPRGLNGRRHLTAAGTTTPSWPQASPAAAAAAVLSLCSAAGAAAAAPACAAAALAARARSLASARLCAFAAAFAAAMAAATSASSCGSPNDGPVAGKSPHPVSYSSPEAGSDTGGRQPACEPSCPPSSVRATNRARGQG